MEMSSKTKQEHLGLGIAMLEVNKRLLALRMDQLGMMLGDCHRLMRSEVKSEQIMGSLLKMQVLEAIAEKQVG